MLQRREAYAPLRAVGSPRNISDAVLFLASDRASYMTGQDLSVDGGVEQLVMKNIPTPVIKA